MLQAPREANLEPPRFEDRRAVFWVTFHNHSLLNPEAIAWLNRFAHLPVNDRQRLALIYLRQREQIANGDYRRLNHVDPLVAGQEVHGLVDRGLVEQQRVGRWTFYTLSVSEDGVAPRSGGTSVSPDEEKILAYVRQHGSINNTQCRELLQVEQTRAYDVLDRLRIAGRLKPEGSGRWRRYVFP